MPKRTLSELTIHPFNLEVYGVPDITGVKESLKQFGLEYPIEVDPKGRILSGGRRWKAAKELGWKDIETKEIQPKDEADARKHILLANAYRSVKTVFVRQKETDAYQRLLRRGEMTKEELASLARQHGKVPSNAEDLKPQKLAAAAAGISASTYQQAVYVTDPARGEAEITKAAREGLIASGHAKTLKKKLKETRRVFKSDQISADRAASEVRQGLREARLEHGYTEKELWQRAANEAGIEAIRKGKAFVNAIYQLGHSQHAKHLGPRVAFILAGTVHEAKQALEALAKKGRLSLPTKPSELKKYAEAEEVEYKIID